MSPGTAKTTVETLPHGGRVRLGGELVSVPTAHAAQEIQYSHRRQWSVAIPWGDVTTAYVSTKIPNITVYTAMPRAVMPLLRLSRPFAPLLGAAQLQRLLKGAVHRWIDGPSESELASGRTYLWGRVSDSSGRAIEGTLTVPQGYRHTVDASLAIAERVLAGDVAAGAWTPSRALGADFVRCLPGVEMHVPRREAAPLVNS